MTWEERLEIAFWLPEIKEEKVVNKLSGRIYDGNEKFTAHFERERSTNAFAGVKQSSVAIKEIF